MTDRNLSPAPRTSLEVFTDQHGPVLGGALHSIALDAQCRKVERLRGLQAQLADNNALMETRKREQQQALTPFDKRIEECTAALQRAVSERAQAVAKQESLVKYQNRAAELIKEIHAPDPTVSRGNWARPTGYVEEPALPEMPDIRKSR
jgi:hypothetical protein